MKCEQLLDVVFSDPAWVVEIVRQVFRHDLFERCEGDKKEGALYDLESNGTVDLPALQKLLRDKCILDERLLRLFPIWNQMDNGMFERCVDLLQQFELMYKIPQSDVERHQPRQYMVPLFLRAGFVGSEGRKVKIGSSGMRESLQKHVTKSSSRLSGVQPLSTLQRYHLFVFFPEGLLFRVIARTFRIAEYYKLSEKEAKAVYKHKSGLSVVVKLAVQVASDGSGVLSITCMCDKESEEAREIVDRTRALFAHEVDQLMEESFRFVPFEVDLVPCLLRKETENKRNSAPRRLGSLYVCREAKDFSYFDEQDQQVIEWKLEKRDRYMVKKYCQDAISQQLEKENQTLDHLLHVGKDIRGKLKRNFRLCVSELEVNDPLRERFSAFEAKYPDVTSLTCKHAEQFLKLVRQFLSRLRTEFDCFLAHKWGEGGLNHEAVVQIKKGLEKKGLKCWVDSTEMQSNINEMLKGIDKSQVFVACITKDYLNAVERKDSYCQIEYSHAVAYKLSDDLVPMFMDEKIAHPHFLQTLPKMAWKLHCLSEAALFDRVLQQLFPDDDVLSRPLLLRMYPANYGS